MNKLKSYSTQTSDFAFLHFIVLTWGFSAILGLMIDLPSVELVFFRTLLSAVGLAIVLYLAGKSFILNSPRDFIKVFIVGVLIAIHWIFFFLSARVSTASVCLAGMATTSFWTSLIEPIFFRKKIKTFEVVLSLLALGGMLIIFNVEYDHILGIVLALSSALFAAWFTVINATLTHTNEHFALTFYEMLVASLVTAAFFPIYSIYFTDLPLALNPSLSDWFYLLILAGVCTVFAYSYSIELMKRLSAFAVNLTVNLEPVYGIILALIFFGEKEQMSSGFYLGTGLILLSVLIYPVWNKRMRRKALETDLLR